MSMSELVSRLSPATFTVIATLLFLAVFVAMAARALSRRQRPVQDAARSLPLCDDDRPSHRGLR